MIRQGLLALLKLLPNRRQENEANPPPDQRHGPDHRDPSSRRHRSSLI